jgi:hypothetical protein
VDRVEWSGVSVSGCVVDMDTPSCVQVGRIRLQCCSAATNCATLHSSTSGRSDDWPSVRQWMERQTESVVSIHFLFRAINQGQSQAAVTNNRQSHFPPETKPEAVGRHKHAKAHTNRAVLWDELVVPAFWCSVDEVRDVVGQGLKVLGIGQQTRDGHVAGAQTYRKFYIAEILSAGGRQKYDCRSGGGVG